MDNLLFLLKGIATGIVVGFPSGPVGFLYIKRATTDGFLAGLISGLGSTLAHFVFILILIFCYGEVLEIYHGHDKLVTFIFSIFLIILGIIIFKSNKKKDYTEDSAETLLGYLATAFIITITNPVVFMQFTLLFPFLKITSNNYFGIISLIFGIIIGSMFWPILSSFGISKVRHSISNKKVIYLQKTIGGIIVAIGLFYIFKNLI